MSSWDHSVSAVSSDESERARVASEREPNHRWWRCCVLKCLEPYTHRHEFRYVTGRGGRVSTRTRLICSKHAESAAKRNKVTIQGEQDADQ